MAGLRTILGIVGAFGLALGGAFADAAPPEVLDDFEATHRWHATASDGVAVSIQPDDGALRIDVDFTSGAGYCVVRRDVDLTLPENFDLALDVRARNLPPNNLELKLITPETKDGIDVWWVNRRAFEFPSDWRTLHSRRRHFEFAWGPSGGSVPLGRLAAVEIAIASAEGGRGTVWLDNLTLESLPVVQPYRGTARVRASSGLDGWRDVAASQSLDWRSAPDDDAPWFEIDFKQTRAFGGLILEWADGAGVSHYRIETAIDGGDWSEAARRSGGDTGRDAFFLPDTIARRVRLSVDSPAPARGVGLAGFTILEPEAGQDLNAFVERLGDVVPRGWLPEPFYARQSFWTVVGAPHSAHEVLISERGVIELSKGGPSLEPFIALESGLVTWADASTSVSLLDDRLPIPTVAWRAAGLTLEVTPVADTAPDADRVVVRYRLRNDGTTGHEGRLAVALRPFQVLPPWQRLNLIGGVSPIDRLATADHAFTYNGTAGPRALTPPAQVHLARFDDADIVRQIILPENVSAAAGAMAAPSLRHTGAPSQEITDPIGLASGVLLFPFSLEPEAITDVFIEIPLGERHAGARPADPATDFERTLKHGAATWSELLSRTTITLPPSAKRVADVLDANLAYILINQDGDAIQPGSRTYERSWIRDGCMTSAALLAMGHHRNVRDYLEWYAPFQFQSGKVPCVVDRRGPDPVDEHDSTGQLIHALRNYARVTGDTEFLRAHYDHVVRGVAYLQSLRAQRLTPEYADPGSPLHARYGLVPESISHEGYSAKPMHSYWDDFFVLRGFLDAAAIARALGKDADAERFGAIASEFQGHLSDSIALAMEQHAIDYIPGCVELGDFDATSTAIAIHPCALLGSVATRADFDATFDRYWDHFLARRGDAKAWHDYTPYEARIIGALVRLGHPDRARELMDWLMLDLLPAEWNHWAEVAYREDHHPGWIGDMPHTWVGAGFINSVITMFAYTRPTDEALVIGAGLDPAWLSEADPLTKTRGVGVTRLHTYHGPLTYSIAREGDTITLVLGDSITVPPGGVILRVPGETPIKGVTLDGAPLGASPAREIRIDRVPATAVVTLEETPS